MPHNVAGYGCPLNRGLNEKKKRKKNRLIFVCEQIASEYMGESFQDYSRIQDFETDFP